jgi:hypothetical protein
VTSNPTNQTVTAGQTATFTATATGTPTPTVQWQLSTNSGSSWSNISGATSTTYSFTAASTQNGNEFRAVFTNSVGSATTTAATLTVNTTTSAPTITTQPSNVTVTAGQTANFTAAATGTPTPTVQWQLSTNSGSTWSNITGATSTTYSFTAATSQSGSEYRAVFTNSAGSATSNAATLTVNAASQTPTFVHASANQTHNGANSVTLGSSSTAGDTIVVELDFASSAGFTSISDNQGNTYVEIGTQQTSTSFGASSRLYYATNIKGGTLTVSSALSGTPSFHELYVNEYSGINTASPLDGFSVNVGTGSSFTSNSVTTTAANDLLYGIEIDVATASAAAGWTARSTYDSNIDADRTASTAGNYAFTGSSSGSYIAWIAAFKDGSAAATAPAITTQPSNATVTAGQPATLTAVATGTALLSYQWQKMVSGSWANVANGGDITGAATASLSFSASVAADAGQYRVVVTNSAGSATSNTASLTVNSAVVGTGTGLTGQYFNDQTLTNLVLTRTDPTVSFNWDSGSPDPSVPVDHFSARWTGQVQAQFSETYTFYTDSDDGVRLWVNGVQLVNNWTDHANTENSGTVALVAGQKYDIKMEYYENGGQAVAKLLWSSPSTAKQAVPTSQLYAAAWTVTTGETNIMPSDDNGNANLLLAQKTTLAQAGTLQSLSFYVTQAAGSLVLGVYDASGPNGGPGKLLAQTSSFTPVVGWNTANAITPVHLAPGTYWLAYLPSDNNLHFRVDRTSGTLEWYSFAFGSMASTFSTTPNIETGHWSLYATLIPG